MVDCVGNLPPVDQNNGNGVGIAAQEFPDFANAVLEAADDFVVPGTAGEPVSICTIVVDGFDTGTANVVTDNDVRVVIYADAGGVPGAEVYNEIISGAIADPEDDKDLLLEFSNVNSPTLAPAAELVAGETYWLSVSVIAAFGTYGQWFWVGSATPAGAPMQFRNPAALIANPCIDWGASVADCGIGANVSAAFLMTFNDLSDCADAPLNLGCIADINVTLNEDCSARITPSMVVTGNAECADEIIITIDGEQTDMVVGCGEHTYSVEVFENGESVYTCWGNVFAEDKTAPEVECPADATSVDVVVESYPINGELTATDPTLAISNWSCFQDFFSPLAGDHPYDVLEITVGATDFYTFDVDSDFGDAGMTIYQGGFDVTNPCQNIIGTNGDAFGLTGNIFDPRLRFSLPLIAGETYQIVVTNWAPADFGEYVVNIFADDNGSVNGITAVQETQTFDLFCDDVDYIRFTTPQSWIVNADGSLDFTATRNEFFGGSTAALNAFLEKLSRAGLPTATDNCGQILITLTDGGTNGNGDCGDIQMTRTFTIRDPTVPVVTVDPFGGPTDQCPDLLPEQFGDFTGSCDTPVEITFSVADDCELFDNDGDLVISIVSAQLDAFAVDASGDGEIVASEFVSDGSVLGNITDNGDGTFVFAGTYPIITNAMGDNVMHAVRILFEDGCGNQVSEFIEFDVIDCKGPAPVCINGLTVTLMPQQDGGCAMAIWASDFEGSPISDCTGQGPEEFLGNPRVTKYAIYRASTVEADPNFEPNPADTGLVLTDEDDATTVVYVYAFDEEGNYDYCETYVLVQQHTNCNTGLAGNINGVIATEAGETVEGVEVNLSGDMVTAFVTNGDGSYSLDALALGGDYSITPYLNSGFLNGVSTFDLVLMSKHILGVQPLNSAYKMIAADVNNSTSITTLDMIQLRKLILNIDTEFANNTSWRFVAASHNFQDISNPWLTEFPEVENFNNITAEALVADFVGVKVGDVNGSAAAKAQSGDDRTLNGQFNLDVEDINMKAGNTYTVAVTAAEVEGFQGTLALNGAELVDIEYAAATAENFGTHRRLSRHMPSPPSEGGSYLAMSWNGDIVKGDPLFSLVIRATQDAELSEVLSVNSRYTVAEAYEGNNTMDLGINFSGLTVEAGFEVYQNTPNPFQAETLIGFNLPVDAEVTVTISDVSGRVLNVIRTDATAGYNTINVTKDMIQGATGVLTYTVTAGLRSAETATKTMISVK